MPMIKERRAAAQQTPSRRANERKEEPLSPTEADEPTGVVYPAKGKKSRSLADA
jgi:hypothetical protein